ncbi:MAG: hypothetical protein LBI05_10465 [Planctomycetaceae bacterium]|jgi:hypothetical protein|nr:hypothetical protein [Planctomycetaceae bacterium]
MSTATGFSYDYVSQLVSRLTPEEQERLIREMDMSCKTKQESVPSMVSHEEIEEFKRMGTQRQRRRTPEELEENRQKLLKIILTCPVMSDEDLQGMIDARKEINECRLA